MQGLPQTYELLAETTPRALSPQKAASDSQLSTPSLVLGSQLSTPPGSQFSTPSTTPRNEFFPPSTALGSQFSMPQMASASMPVEGIVELGRFSAKVALKAQVDPCVAPWAATVPAAAQLQAAGVEDSILVVVTNIAGNEIAKKRFHPHANIDHIRRDFGLSAYFPWQLVHGSAIVPGDKKLQDLEPGSRLEFKLVIMQELGQWPKAEKKPVCEYPSVGEVIIFWVIRADQLLKKGANKQGKLSQPFEVWLRGQWRHFRLKVVSSSGGTGQKQSVFDAVGGRGKVQIRPVEGWPADLPLPLVRIAAGRKSCAQWQGPQVATFPCERDPCFELTNAEFNFAEATEDAACGQQHLHIIVELSIPLQGW
eukprot:CAMPEP_0115668316 /NCGR_PEP_ID=MMETSP0272-20121206/50403_1 /TAXON_ID=71861 /ORGANISM="Scrippsiella trochoidea, Strain CCMP3099" /LENGTH=365 /DNA_ID=CAMNT_0003106911 /DNA_START=73 /DNA_END=1167 /DNA_ORIENTATION=-